MDVNGLDNLLTPFHDAWERQRRLHQAVVDGTAPDTMLLVEHESVYTAGVRTRTEDLPTDGSAVVKVDRGGRITWHGPGQLVGYPIVHLPDGDVVAHIRRLEAALIEVLAALGIVGFTREGKTGVWVGTDEPAKIAAIGTRVAKNVTLHGFALNCSNSLDPYAVIVPCGLHEPVTTISLELGATRTPADLAGLVTQTMVAHLDNTERIPA